MKRTFTAITAWILLALTVAAATSCAAKRDDTVSARRIYDDVIAAFSFSDDEEFYHKDAEELWNVFDDDVLSGKYGSLTGYPSPEDFDDYAAFFSTEAFGPEFGIFRMKDEKKAAEMEKYIAGRIAQMLRLAANYPSVDISRIKNYTVTTDGIWIYYAATDKNGVFNDIVKGFLYPKK